MSILEDTVTVGGYGLHVEEIDRPDPATPPGTEPRVAGIYDGLPDTTRVPPAKAAAVPAADFTADRAGLEEALSRFAPRDGNPMLLVSAGFNSAI